MPAGTNSRVQLPGDPVSLGGQPLTPASDGEKLTEALAGGKVVVVESGAYHFTLDAILSLVESRRPVQESNKQDCRFTSYSDIW